MHPEHPDQVRTVVWVALTHGVPDSLVPLTDGAGSSDTDPDAGSADTAVFWSIWNDDRTVEGVGRGGDLIEGAAELLRAEHPGLSTMVTLSPAPGLRDWANAAERVETAPDPLDRAAAMILAAKRPLVMIGAPQLCERYASSLKFMGYSADAVIDNTAPAGLWNFARAAGLI